MRNFTDRRIVTFPFSMKSLTKCSSPGMKHSCLDRLLLPSDGAESPEWKSLYESTKLARYVSPPTLGTGDKERIVQDVCAYIFELCGELSRQSGGDLNSSSVSAAAGRTESSTGHIVSKLARRAGAPSIDILASSCYAERRLRDQIFEDSTLFGEPAWDILLDVASAEAKGADFRSAASALVLAVLRQPLCGGWVSLKSVTCYGGRKTFWTGAAALSA